MNGKTHQASDHGAIDAPAEKHLVPRAPAAGAAAGGVVGGVIGGPFGAVVGAVVGSVMGTWVSGHHDENPTQDEQEEPGEAASGEHKKTAPAIKAAEPAKPKAVGTKRRSAATSHSSKPKATTAVKRPSLADAKDKPKAPKKPRKKTSATRKKGE